MPSTTAIAKIKQNSFFMFFLRSVDFYRLGNTIERCHNTNGFSAVVKFKLINTHLSVISRGRALSFLLAE